MEKKKCSASVRTIVEFALLAGDLSAGAQMSRMRDGLLGHQARQQALPEARSEVVVRGRVEGEMAVLSISGRIDLLHERDGVPVVEEIKLCPVYGAPEAPIPVHRAQAVCYGHLLGADRVVIRIAYVEKDGRAVAHFEETLSAGELKTEFEGFVRPYLQMLEDRIHWCAIRDASIAGMAFPFDGFRAGQREMAVQTFWAIKSRRRLFAQAPTGTGKTAAALFPALKALGEGLTGQLFYLTARNTAQQNASLAIERMRGQGLRLRALSMTAREKICPCPPAAEPRPESASEEGAEKKPPFRCDVFTCPLALGFFDRLPEALSAMRDRDDWGRAAVEAVAARHRVCPFEFSLHLCEEADMVLCDYNYAFDPGARIRRIFLWNTNLSLLVDEAHNLPDRAREMLSAVIDSRALREARRALGKALGAKAPLYRTLTALIRWAEARPEGVETAFPEDLPPLLEACMEQALLASEHIPLGDLPRTLITALGTLERFDAQYAILTEETGKAGRRVSLLCLDPGPHLREATAKLRGCVFFSATLTPLQAWRDAMGGEEEDGLLALPSPFPQENLLVLRQNISTKYKAREGTAAAVAEAIIEMARARPGNYLACFPSYAYLQRVRAEIEEMDSAILLHVQRGGMDEAAREAYLTAFTPRQEGALLGMVVLGGVFGEGVDLPGDRLSGVAVVGVGLPQICKERELLRDYYQLTLADGFAHAYRYPGMNKVLQAVGRVIRTETDRGVALLIDDRFLLSEYAELMPPWWGEAAWVRSPLEMRARLEQFWRPEQM